MVHILRSLIAEVRQLIQSARRGVSAAIDKILLRQWIAFNAFYGQWDQTALEPAADRRSQLVDSALGFAYARPNCISLAAIPWL
ncbi:MAG TPA: hypothetical protein VMM76_26045 [Pirellulaceae bacterium]|nr:hypothetical protein [Pirellulaceae bacterium]